MNGENIVKFINSQRIGWLDNINRMEVGAMPRRMMKGRLFAGRKKGRPRVRWLDDVVADLKVMKISAVNGEDERQRAVRLVVEEDKAHPGL